MEHPIRKEELLGVRGDKTSRFHSSHTVLQNGCNGIRVRETRPRVRVWKPQMGHTASAGSLSAKDSCLGIEGGCRQPTRR